MKTVKLIAWSVFVAGLSVVTGFSIPLPKLSVDDECALFVQHQLSQLPKGKPALIPRPWTSYKLCVDRMQTHVKGPRGRAQAHK